MSWFGIWETAVNIFIGRLIRAEYRGGQLKNQVGHSLVGTAIGLRGNV